MRLLTSAEASALDSPAGYSTHLRVRVRRPDGTDEYLQDFLDVLGTDVLMSAEWTEDTEGSVALATVRVRRNGPGGRFSLSPLVASSPANYEADGDFAPLLEVERQFRIDVASVTLGADPAGADWREVFFGRIDSVTVSEEEVSFSGRDYGGLYQDTFIEVERTYGNDTVGVAAQSVMTLICTTEGLDGPYTPVDPLWQLGRYIQRREPVMDAVRTLAQQLGWECRLKWREGVGFTLTFFSPARSATVAQWAFGPGDYAKLDNVRRVIDDIRNVVEVVYSDINDRDATGTAKRKTVTLSDATSIAKYGRRWMQIAEAANSNINTAAEATRLAQAALSDLADSALELTLTVDFFWAVELGDMIAVDPDGVTFDAQQVLAVQSIEQKFDSDGRSTTTLRLRGKPSMSVDLWMARNAYPANLNARTTGPAAVEGLVATDTVNGAVVSFTPAATGAKWDLFELHVSTTSGFTPSTATLKTAGSNTRFDVTGLPAGVTHYAKVVPKTANGSAGTASAQVAVTPRYTAPLDLLPSTAGGALLPANNSFEATTLASAPPDTWEMLVGTWGVDAVINTTTVHSGGKAVLMSTATATSLASQRFLVVPDDELKVDVFAAAPTVAFSTTVGTAYVDWFADTSNTPLSTSTVSNLPGTLTFFNPYNRAKATLIAPALARYARVRVVKAAGTFNLYLDSVRVFVTPAP